jgi:hypothetical protein
MTAYLKIACLSAFALCAAPLAGQSYPLGGPVAGRGSSAHRKGRLLERLLARRMAKPLPLGIGTSLLAQSREKPLSLGILRQLRTQSLVQP